jgi:hypothetical protein
MVVDERWQHLKVLVARNTFAKLPLWMLGFLY